MIIKDNFDLGTIKYTYDDIIRRTNSIEYFIIPELIECDYNTRCINITRAAGGWISRRWVAKVLKHCCDLTPQEYFDLVVLRINDTELRPKCHNCNSNLSFTSIIYGYSTHPWFSIDEAYCSHSCVAANSNKTNKTGFGTFTTNIKSRKTQFIRLGNADDICEFYITVSRGKFKYGISQNTLVRSYYNHTYDSAPRKFKVLIRSNRLKIAELEYLIKLELGLADEYLVFNSSMEKFRNAFYKACKELNLM